MEITHSPLYPAIKSVFDSGATRGSYGWIAEVHCKDDKGNDMIFKSMKVMGLSVHRDYVNNFADEITCQILIPLGKYARKIYPNRDSLEVTLYKHLAGESIGAAEKHKSQNMIDRYTAILLNQDRSPDIGQGRESMSEEALDHSGILQINLQLIPKTIEKVRTMQFGGILGKADVANMIKGVLTITTEQIKIDNKKAIELIDVLPSTNKAMKSQITVPHGTLLIDFPGFIQSRVGVYNSGMGSYIQNRNWYIYYLYDLTKLKDRKDTITFIIVPPNKFPYVERTYKNDNGSITVLITGETLFKDDNGTNKLNHGTGARFTDADALIKEPVVVKDNKAIISRGKINNEFSTDKKAKVTNSPSAGNKITANSHKHISEIMSRDGGTFKAVWQNADLELIRPGVFARILYDDNGIIKELNGILHRCEYMSIPRGGLTGTSYTNVAKLEFFAKLKEIK